MSCSLHGSVLVYRTNCVIGGDTDNHWKQSLQFRTEKSQSDRLSKVTSSVTGENVLCDSQSLYFSAVTQRHSGIVAKKHISTVLFSHVKKMLRYK